MSSGRAKSHKITAKLALNPTERQVLLDGERLKGVTGIKIGAAVGEYPEIVLTMCADVELDLEVFAPIPVEMSTATYVDALAAVSQKLRAKYFKAEDDTERAEIMKRVSALDVLWGGDDE